MQATEPAVVTPELLQRFCGVLENEIRYYLCKPWRRDGFLYATNGHIAIEIADDGRDAVDWTPSHPLVHKLFDKYPATEFVPMPALGPTKPEHRCERCSGDGFHFVVRCEDCGGSGEFDHGRHSYKCENCNGEGAIGSEDVKTICLLCDGFGEDGSWRGEEAVIGDAGFQARYLRLFAQLPNCEIAPADRINGAQVRFAGGRGMVMPMRARPAASVGEAA